MVYKERRQTIIKDLINKDEQVSVKTLADKFEVSEVTIRRDLNELEANGCIKRTHGGAVSGDALFPLSFKKIVSQIDFQSDEKQQIGQYVASLIKPGDTIYIGAGTTAYWVAKNISAVNDLTVVSNSLLIANLIAQIDSINMIMVGGYLRRREYTFVGHFAEMTLKNLHFDKVIVGMSGVHPEYGFTSFHPPEVMTDETFLHVSDNVIVVLDHTKFGRISTHRIAEISSVEKIVTTSQAPKEMVEEIRQRGVEIVLL